MWRGAEQEQGLGTLWPGGKGYDLETGGSGPETGESSRKTWGSDPGSGERIQPEAVLSPPLLRKPNWCHFPESPHRTVFSLAHC